MTVDIFSQYFRSECGVGENARNGALVSLTADSENGSVCYTASVAFFAHKSADDFSVNYDVFESAVLYNSKGRRSKKREAEFMKNLPSIIDELAQKRNGRIFWNEPLRAARCVLCNNNCH